MYIQLLYIKVLNRIIESSKNISDVKTSIIIIFYSNTLIKDKLLLVLKPYDLSIEQFNVMRILRGQKGNPINLQDIQERMINKMSNTTRLVDKLIKKGFVKRTTCRVNRRKVDIIITDLGLKSLSELDSKIDTVEAKIVENLSSNEIRQLNKLLLKLNN